MSSFLPSTFLIINKMGASSSKSEPQTVKSNSLVLLNEENSALLKTLGDSGLLTKIMELQKQGRYMAMQYYEVLQTTVNMTTCEVCYFMEVVCKEIYMVYEQRFKGGANVIRENPRQSSDTIRKHAFNVVLTKVNQNIPALINAIDKLLEQKGGRRIRKCRLHTT